jgi:uncharacterized membrane protein YcaP (DUF421 family)
MDGGIPMEVVILLLRTLFFYFLIRISMRLLSRGRKVTLLDLLVAFMIGEMSVLSISPPDKPLFLSILPILVLFTIHFSTTQKKSWTSTQSHSKSYPAVFKPKTADMEAALMEPVPITAPAGQLPVPLILDGKVFYQNLEKIGRNVFWLKNEVQKFGIRKFNEVSYCSIDVYGRIFLDPKR